LLHHGQVVSHPFVVGEIACGQLRNRREILSLLANLPIAPLLEHAEALTFLETHALAGAGIGWVDVHLLGSAVLGRHVLWTLDRRLERAAKRLHVAPPGR